MVAGPVSSFSDRGCWTCGDGQDLLPHVLAIPVGETVVFRNDDPYFHNVFSLSPVRNVDAGHLYVVDPRQSQLGY